jgi:flagellin-like hook-associated protein FlgL
MAEVSLSSGIRTTLSSLSDTAKQLETTTDRLSTGKKVSTAVDNPTNYFAAENYNDRANALESRLDGMSEAIQQITAADNGITNIRGFLSQMKGIVNDALSNTEADDRDALGKQFNELILQVRDMAKDSSYGGINLVYDNASTTVQFNERIGNSTLTIQGFNISANSGALDETTGEITASSVTGGDYTGYGISLDVNDGDIVGIKSYGKTETSASGHEVNWGGTDYQESLASVIEQIEDVEGALKTQASKLATNLAVITQRQEFTNEAINILEVGADNLTLADMNEEGAKLLALQTASSLGVQSMSMASEQASNVLRILQ